MDFEDTPEEHAFRLEARQWLAENAPHELESELRSVPLGSLELKGADPLAAARAWQKRKFDAGWAVLHWPKAYGGRDTTPIQRIIWGEEEGVYGKLSSPFGIGQGMVAPTLMTYATAPVREAHLPRLASGEELWCQLFSEPAAGSDLAGLRTRADPVAGGWRINGQKCWTSWAHEADHGMLLARSDFDAVKHRGLTMFFLDMKSPGVEVRPIRMMNDKRVFNEVFFTDVFIPDENRLGEVGGGWRASMTTLMNERTGRLPTGFPELLDLCRRPQADGRRPIDDPAVRARIARWATIESGLKYTSLRSISALSKGEEPGPENSIGKLAAARALQETTTYALELLGEGGLEADAPPGSGDGWLRAMFLRAPAVRIEAGSDEILRTIIAERVLGLPQDIRADKDLPFSEIPWSASGDR